MKPDSILQAEVTDRTFKPSSPPATTMKPSTFELPDNSVSPETKSKYKKLKRSEEYIFTVRMEGLEPVFEISSRRADSVYGTIQGDHVTAYSCLLQSLYRNFELRTLTEAKDGIMKVAEILLPEHRLLFQKVITEHEKKATIFPSQETRREISTSIKQVNQLGWTVNNIITDPEVVKLLIDKGLIINTDEVRKQVEATSMLDKESNKIKNGLKSNEIRIFADLIVEIGNLLIKQLNTQEDICYLNMFNNSEHGNEVKYSRYALNSLDLLLELEQSVCQKNKIAFLTADSNYIVDNLEPQDIQRIHDLFHCTRSEFKSGLKKLFESKNLDLCKRTEDPKLLARFLFYNLRLLDIPTIAGKLITNLFDFQRKTHIDDCNVLQKLALTCAIHLVVMAQIFPNLSTDLELKKQIEYNFLQEGVLKQQGWEEHIIPNRREANKSKKTLDCNTLIQNIQELKSTKHCGLLEYISLSQDDIKRFTPNKKRKVSSSEKDLSLIDNPPNTIFSPDRVSRKLFTRSRS